MQQLLPPPHAKDGEYSEASYSESEVSDGAREALALWPAWAKKRDEALAARQAMHGTASSSADHPNTAVLHAVEADLDAETHDDALVAEATTAMSAGVQLTLHVPQPGVGWRQLPVRAMLSADEKVLSLEGKSDFKGNIQLSSTTKIVYTAGQYALGEGRSSAESDIPPLADHMAATLHFAVVCEGGRQRFFLSADTGTVCEQMVLGLRALAGLPIDRPAYLWQRAACVWLHRQPPGATLANLPKQLRATRHMAVQHLGHLSRESLEMQSV